MKSKRGFTLLELVVVIIILALLSIVIVPKFVNLTVQTHNAAASGVAGAIAWGSSVNYAARQSVSASSVLLNSANICTAATIQSLLTGNSITLTATAPLTDDQYQISGTGDCSGSAMSVVCTVTPTGFGVTAASAPVLCAR